MLRSSLVIALLLAASTAGAVVPANGAPSAAAKAKSRFATTFYVMHWNKPEVLDYRYDASRGELHLRVEHLGRHKSERALLEFTLKADKPGKYPMPGSGSGSFHVIGCTNTLVAGASHVQITRIDAERVEGTFHLQGHCAAMASNSETLRDGRFSLVFDQPARK